MDFSIAALLTLVRLGRRPDPAKDAPWRPAAMVPGFDFAGTSKFRYDRGGDYHDLFMPPGDGRMAVAVGDVAGHDAQAARLMTLARDFLRARPALPGRLAGLMEGVNRDLTPHMKAGRFMTLFLAVLSSEPRSIHWVNAGQGAAIAYNPQSCSFSGIGGPDIPLGIDSDWHFHELEHSGWPDGALLVIGTDGVWETRNPAGEMYGTERLCRALRRVCPLAASDILAELMADLTLFRAGRPQDDDVTLVVIKAV